MRRVNSKPVDRKVFTCPQCGKQRMIRDLDHKVSLDKQTYKTKDGGEVELFVDTCDNCRERNFKRYFEPSKADIRKVLKKLHENEEIGEDQSLEELL